MATPRVEKPENIMAQLEGSGTRAMVVKLHLNLCAAEKPAGTLGLVAG